MKRKATRLWVGRIALALLGPLFWLELILQIAALFTPNAPADATAPTAAAEPCCVLCVGDSFTFGLGAAAADGSYPAQLEARLRAAPIDGRWRVANAGVPSRNSRDVLLDLPRQVRRERPRFVVVMVGINDVWSRPGRADVHEAARDAGFAATWHFEWRTRKLLQLLIHNPKRATLFAGLGGHAASDLPPGTKQDAAVAPPKPPAKRPRPAKRTSDVDVQTSYDVVGRWQSGSETIRFARDGGGARGATELRWRIARAGELVLKLADAPAELRMKAQRIRGRLLLTPEGATLPVAFDWAPAPVADAATAPSPDWYGEYARLNAAGDVSGAVAWTERWIAAEPDDPGARFSHMEAASHAPKSDLTVDLAVIERIHETTATRDAAENLVRACDLVHQSGRAADLARVELERFPDSIGLRFRLAEACDGAGDFDSAVREMDGVIAREDDTPGSFLGYQYRERARWNDRLRREVAAASDLVRALRAEADLKLLLQVLLRGQFEESALDDAFTATEATDAERATIHRLFDEARDALSPAPPPNFVDHLTQIVRWVRDQGAEPLLCTYPFHGGSVDQGQRTVARSEHVRLVEITARFVELLKTHAREELFVPDGHCNDAGYRIVAEEVAAALHELAR